MEGGEWESGGTGSKSEGWSQSSVSVVIHRFGLCLPARLPAREQKKGASGDCGKTNTTKVAAPPWDDLLTIVKPFL